MVLPSHLPWLICGIVGWKVSSREVFGKKIKLTDFKSHSSASPCICVFAIASSVCLYQSITVVAAVCVMIAVCAYAGFEVKSSVKG